MLGLHSGNTNTINAGNILGKSTVILTRTVVQANTAITGRPTHK